MPLCDYILGEALFCVSFTTHNIKESRSRMAIKRVGKNINLEILIQHGFSFGMADWVQAKIGKHYEECNRYEVIFETDQMDTLSTVLYFNESCTILIGIDEVVVDKNNHNLKFDFETTPCWVKLQQAMKSIEAGVNCT